MKIKTLKALRGSIKKWEGILAGETVDRAASNCPLCKLFWNKTDCVGCPVFEKTGRKNCNRTPYTTWARYGFSQMDKSNITDPSSIKLWERLAGREVEFLRSLLPRRKKTK